MSSDIPIDDHPRTVRELREAWAQAYTENGTLRREVESLKEALRLRGNSLDQITDHCTRQGLYIQTLDAKVASERKEYEAIIDTLNRSMAYARKTDKSSREDIKQLRSELAEVLQNNAVGKDCPDCDGTGMLTDEVMYSDPSRHDAPYGTRSELVECGECYGGRVAK